jgi:hypothetical protein
VTSLSLAGLALACSAVCQLPADVLTALSALSMLNLAGTSFGLQLSDVSQLSLLETLDLSYMPNLQGPLPADWPAHLPNLRALRLSGLHAIVSAVCAGCLWAGASTPADAG